jgi:hypothetical protein
MIPVRIVLSCSMRRCRRPYRRFHCAGVPDGPILESFTRSRTLENWEQGRAKPNAQAALLINLVKQYRDTVQRLAAI